MDLIQPAFILSHTDASILKVSPAQALITGRKEQSFLFPGRFPREARDDNAVGQKLEAVVKSLGGSLPPEGERAWASDHCLDPAFFKIGNRPALRGIHTVMSHERLSEPGCRPSGAPCQFRGIESICQHSNQQDGGRTGD